jgi:hypothetical protein
MIRLVASALLLAALVVASIHTTATATRPPFAVPCSASSLAGAFAGPLQLDSIDHFGCEGSWAFTWATIGTEPHKVGVTEVLHFNTVTSRWNFASRATVCKPEVLPPDVYRLGCFSN